MATSAEADITKAQRLREMADIVISRQAADVLRNAADRLENRAARKAAKLARRRSPRNRFR